MINHHLGRDGDSSTEIVGIEGHRAVLDPLLLQLEERAVNPPGIHFKNGWVNQNQLLFRAQQIEMLFPKIGSNRMTKPKILHQSPTLKQTGEGRRTSWKRHFSEPLKFWAHVGSPAFFQLGFSREFRLPNRFEKKKGKKKSLGK